MLVHAWGCNTHLVLVNRAGAVLVGKHQELRQLHLVHRVGEPHLRSARGELRCRRPALDPLRLRVVGCMFVQLLLPSHRVARRVSFSGSAGEIDVDV
jgi:hypothetical protein